MEKTDISMEDVKLQDAREDAIPTTHSLHQNDVVGGDAGNDFWCDDGSLCNESNEADIAFDLDREWQTRHNRFHTIGYRDGLTSGKEASAQEGFNIGFKKSVPVGQKWGYVRGVTSAMICLPDVLGRKLVEKIETREKLQRLYESVRSISTQDALNEFHADIIGSKSKEHYECSDENLHDANMPHITSDSSPLEMYTRDFESLKLGSSGIRLHQGKFQFQ